MFLPIEKGELLDPAPRGRRDVLVANETIERGGEVVLRETFLEKRARSGHLVGKPWPDGEA